jgi:hypothetical protein
MLAPLVSPLRSGVDSKSITFRTRQLKTSKFGQISPGFYEHPSDIHVNITHDPTPWSLRCGINSCNVIPYYEEMGLFLLQLADMTPNTIRRIRMASRKFKLGTNNCYRNAFALLLALTLLSQNGSSHASDFLLYECKSDLGSMIGAEIGAEMSGGDSDLASAMETLTPHHIYKLDLINKMVTYRMLNNKGREFGLLGMGQRTKYTTEIQLDGNHITWNNVISDSPEGSIVSTNTFNLKNTKLHVVTTIKLTSGEPPQSIDEDHTCTPYSPKKTY